MPYQMNLFVKWWIRNRRNLPTYFNAATFNIYQNRASEFGALSIYFFSIIIMEPLEKGTKTTAVG